MYSARPGPPVGSARKEDVARPLLTWKSKRYIRGGSAYHVPGRFKDFVSPFIIHIKPLKYAVVLSPLCYRRRQRSPVLPGVFTLNVVCVAKQP